MSVVNQITVENLNEIIKSQEILILDVRTPGEYKSMHIFGAVNCPLPDLENSDFIRSLPENQTVYVVCASGNRSTQACSKLTEFTTLRVINVIGGTNAWHEKGYLVEYGAGSISIMRQVQIVVGGFVVLFCSLALFAGIGFLAVVFFFGAGLLYAGISGTCMLAKILEKMPWNK